MSITKSQAEMQAELIRRMSEPEPLRKLRNQKERMEEERRRQYKKQREMSEAERLREEIRRMGGTPCA